MKLFAQFLVLGLAAEAVVASSWFSKAGTFHFSLLEYLHFCPTLLPYFSFIYSKPAWYFRTKNNTDLSSPFLYCISNCLTDI
jgi:hypothetical protein